jgi:hypothetical protein
VKYNDRDRKTTGGEPVVFFVISPHPAMDKMRHQTILALPLSISFVDREGRTIVVDRSRYPLSADEGRGEGDRG